MMKRLVLSLPILALLVVFSSCASKPEDTTKTDREKISTVPWNKPQSWEGKGALGGLVQ
ncbi:MAG: hypothetical protein HC904_03370 [Blastochloris sp.]|nr:hypothetical protein [Blastochloris sp.]